MVYHRINTPSKNDSRINIYLYHGTSFDSARLIVNGTLANKGGFKDRDETGVSNWGKDKDGVVEGKESQKGFVYLTRAYPFFYGQAAASDNDKVACVLKVRVKKTDLYPDEDYLREKGIVGQDEEINLEDYKEYALASLKELGNVAIKTKDINKSTFRVKEFDIAEMYHYSDPTMSTLNYRFCGGYYRKLTDYWWYGVKNWRKVIMAEEIINDMSKSLGK